MKQLRCLYLTMLASGFFIHPVVCQTHHKWQFGISANRGQDYYNRKFYVAEMLPYWVSDFRSKKSWGGSVWGERGIGKNFSAIVELSYRKIEVPFNTICQCSFVGKAYRSESHEWGSLGGGVRWYLNPANKVNVFVDGKVKADYFIALTERALEGKYIYWHARGYRRINPSLSTAIGVKWKRLAVGLEYDRNVPRTFIRNVGYYPIKTGLLRQTLSVKAAFTIRYVQD